MEENQRRKKKIKKWIKFSCWIAFGLLLIIIGVTGCVKTKALEPIENYNIYTNMGQLTGVSNNNTLYTLDFTGTRIYYYYNGSNYETTDRYHNYIFYFDSNDLQNEVNETLKIDINELQIGTIVLFGGFVDEDNQEYYIDRITTITRYYDAITDTAYSNGYGTGITENDVNAAYTNGYEEGYNLREYQYQIQLEEQQANYDKAINSANAETQRWKDLYESGTTAWGSFKGLLGMIVTFPIQWFKEGLDVNIFGVNVGGFILGIGIIIIILTIIGLFKGRGTRNE